MSERTIGFVGLGNMGWPMAANLHAAGFPLVVRDAAADRVLGRFYRDVAGPHWPPERRHVEDGYAALPFPFAEVAAPPLAIETAWSRADLEGYVETWSATAALRRAAGEAPVTQFREQLAAAWPAGQERLSVRWPLALRAGKV